jgi:hypothetical protein
MLRILDLVSLGMEITGETLDVILGALADQLQLLADRQEIVVIGGSTLTALWPGQAGDQGRGSRCDRSGR